MQYRFNQAKYWERMRQGEFAAIVIDQHQPQPEVAAKEPVGTVSQMVSYRDVDNNEVVRVHQYLRPDGTLAASGRPDPKRLLENGVLYLLIKKPK